MFSKSINIILAMSITSAAFAYDTPKKVGPGMILIEARIPNRIVLKCGKDKECIERERQKEWEAQQKISHTDDKNHSKNSSSSSDGGNNGGSGQAEIQDEQTVLESITDFITEHPELILATAASAGALTVAVVKGASLASVLYTGLYGAGVIAGTLVGAYLGVPPAVTAATIASVFMFGAPAVAKQAWSIGKWGFSAFNALSGVAANASSQEQAREPEKQLLINGIEE